MKHSNDLKLAVVKRYLRGGIVYRDLAASVGISKSVLQRWVAWYEAHGGFDSATPAQIPDAEFKLAALRYMWENRVSYAEVTLRFKIEGHNTLRQWAHQYRQDGLEALMPNQTRQPKSMTIPTTKPELKSGEEPSVEELLKQNLQLRMENAYLKKLQALVQSRVSNAPLKKRK